MKERQGFDNPSFFMDTEEITAIHFKYDLNYFEVRKRDSNLSYSVLVLALLVGDTKQ